MNLLSLLKFNAFTILTFFIEYYATNAQIKDELNKKESPRIHELKNKWNILFVLNSCIRGNSSIF